MVHQIDRPKMSKKRKENIRLTEAVPYFSPKSSYTLSLQCIKIKQGEKEERLKVRGSIGKFRSTFCRLEWHDQPKFGLYVVLEIL